MNNKDAIFYLNQVREDYEYKEFFEGREALDLAIKALEEQERPTECELIKRAFLNSIEIANHIEKLKQEAENDGIRRSN